MRKDGFQEEGCSAKGGTEISTMGSLAGGENSPPPSMTRTPSNLGIKPLLASEFVSISLSMGGCVTGFKGFSGDNPYN